MIGHLQWRSMKKCRERLKVMEAFYLDQINVNGNLEGEIEI
jgi:hypothetical protein